MSRHMKDLTGSTIKGYLVLKQDGWKISAERRRPIWLFQCSCGSTFSAQSNLVATGHNVCKSCRVYGRFKDLTGQQFGKLVVVERLESETNDALWKTKCSECSDTFTHTTDKLKRLKYCPCMVGNGGLKHGHTKSGGARTPTYSSWSNMMARCYQPSYPRKEHYSKKGIKVCQRWHKFENFLADMGERPEGTTLGRRNHDKDYSKSNCRWETWQEQNENRERDDKGKYV